MKLLTKLSTLFFNKKLIHKKPVLVRPNRQETFSPQATEVNNLILFFSFCYHNFEDTVTNFDQDMFRKESFCDTNSWVK